MSQFTKRCSYVPEESRVIYESKDGNGEKAFAALAWLAATCSHTKKAEQMVRHYGYYSNVSRGRRKKQNQDALIPCILEPDEDSKACRRNWARLIQKIYEVDPLVCPKGQGQMRIISFIEDPEVIREILEHLEPWLAKRRPQPRANGPPIEPQLDYSDCQIPLAEDYLYKQSEYPMDVWVS